MLEPGTKLWAWKDGWTHGRVVGFIPYSIFHMDESGDPTRCKECLFFQWPPPKGLWNSLVEGPDLLEYTPADRYHGRRLKDGFRRVKEPPPPKGRQPRLWPRAARPPRPPELWRSVVSQEELEEADAYERLWDLEVKIVNVCKKCAAGESPLLKEGMVYCHGEIYQKVKKCPANRLHGKRDTWAKEIWKTHDGKTEISSTLEPPPSYLRGEF